jgi:hypothetical protein
MQLTDPSYLRNIEQGLFTGIYNKENSFKLPNGLTEIYESYLPPETHVLERKKVLEFFCTWALIKKEISIDFIKPILPNLSAEKILEIFNSHSKLFYISTNGKCTLYHDRIRVFFLQKISHKMLLVFNDNIINKCYKTLNDKKDNEWYIYALENLSTHLLLNAILKKQQNRSLKKIAYNLDFWQQQKQVSGDYKWSHKLLSETMFWASMNNENDVIECTVKQITLSRNEIHNFIRDSLTCISDGDIDNAINKLNSFDNITNESYYYKSNFLLLFIIILKLRHYEVFIDTENTIRHIINEIENNLIEINSKYQISTDIFKEYNNTINETLNLIQEKWLKNKQDESFINIAKDDKKEQNINSVKNYGSMQNSELMVNLDNLTSKIDNPDETCKILTNISAELFKRNYKTDAMRYLEESILIIKKHNVQSAWPTVISNLVLMGRTDDADKYINSLKKSILFCSDREYYDLNNAYEDSLYCGIVASINNNSFPEVWINTLSNNFYHSKIHKYYDRRFKKLQAILEALSQSNLKNRITEIIDIIKEHWAYYVSESFGTIHSHIHFLKFVLPALVKIQISDDMLNEFIKTTNTMLNSENGQTKYINTEKIINTLIAKNKHYEAWIIAENTQNETENNQWKVILTTIKKGYYDDAHGLIKMHINKYNYFGENEKIKIKTERLLIKMKALVHNYKGSLEKFTKLCNTIESEYSVNEKVRDLIEISELAYNQKETEFAGTILDYAGSIIKKSDKIEEDAVQSLAKAYARQYALEKSLNIINILKNPTYRAACILIIIQILCTQGNLNDAVKLSENSELYGLEKEFMGNAITELLEEKIFEKAIELNSYITGEQRFIAYNAIIVALEKNNLKSLAQKTINEAFEYFLNNINHHENHSHYLNYLETIFNHLHKTSKLQTITSLIEIYENTKYRSIIIQQYALYLALKGQINNALRTARTIADISLKGQTFKQLAIIQFRKNKFNESTNIAKAISHQEIENETLCELAIEAAMAGMLEKSQQIGSKIEDNQCRCECWLRIFRKTYCRVNHCEFIIIMKNIYLSEMKDIFTRLWYTKIVESETLSNFSPKEIFSISCFNIWQKTVLLREYITCKIFSEGLSGKEEKLYKECMNITQELNLKRNLDIYLKENPLYSDFN